jgi:hypothetical protein
LELEDGPLSRPASADAALGVKLISSAAGVLLAALRGADALQFYSHIKVLLIQSRYRTYFL